MPFTEKHVHFVPEGFLKKSASLLLGACLISFVTTYFFVPFDFLMFFYVSARIEHTFGRRQTHSLALRLSRLSPWPKPFCLRRCEADDLLDNRLCRTNVCCLRYSCRHRQFVSSAKGCPYRCR